MFSGFCPVSNLISFVISRLRIRLKFRQTSELPCIKVKFPGKAILSAELSTAMVDSISLELQLKRVQGCRESGKLAA
jgi:hypothetical protein